MSSAELMAGVRARFGYSLPVIALTLDDNPDSLVAAFDDGADHCLTWPVTPRLLLAQVNAAMRRMTPGGGRAEAMIGHLAFQPEGMKVYVDDAAVSLTAKEYALALMLCRNLGRPLDRAHLHRTIWGGDLMPLTRTLDVHVSRLRTKLKLRPDRGFQLSALYGRGYQLDHGQAVKASPARGATAIIPRRSASPSDLAAVAHRPPMR